VKKWIIGGVALLVLIGAATSSGSKNSSNSGAAAKSQPAGSASNTQTSASTQTSDKKPPCGIKATDDCTPHVGENGKVRVDALYWQLKSVKTAKTIGDMTYGLGEKADGVFVIADLKAHSVKDESVTLTDNVFQLEVNGKTYDPDSDGTTAAIGAGEQPFFLEDIGPDATTRGKVVFDVPKSVLHKNIEMRFNELGFGTTHGYIALPSLSA
jgi:hypothetical protein